MDTHEPTSAAPTDGSFTDLGIRTEIVDILRGTHLEHPTELQRQLLPHALEGRDCLVQARSGAGKTNAYVLPILEKLEPGSGVQAIVFQPTRATALRVRRSFGRFFENGPGTIAVRAGGGRQPVRDSIDDAPDVLIVSPRCARDIVVEKPDEWWSNLRTIVIDEADTLLEAGDRETLEQVLTAIGPNRQKILIAAELSDELRAVAEAHLNEPVTLEAAPEKPAIQRIRQEWMDIGERDRFEVLVGFCKQMQPRLAVVFVSDEDTAEDVLDRLGRVRVSARSVGQTHSPRRPDRRERDNRRSTCEVVVTTDPAPRRISTIPASHVVHYDVPADIDAYVHRLEQCDRLHRNGASIAFIDTDQHELLERIGERVGTPLAQIEPPEFRESKPRSRDDRGPRRDRDSSRPRSSSRPPSSHSAPPKPAEKAGEGESAPALPKTLGGRFQPRRKPKRMWSF